jgi:SAM-dependent methyltransferase
LEGGDDVRFVDRLLQGWRARKARPWVPEGARVLDVGCHQGEFLFALGERIGPSVGMDPLATPQTRGAVRILADTFRPPLPFADGSFDVIAMLATLEHILDKGPLAQECARLLVPGGRVVITVPARVVDTVVDVLVRLRLADGMSLDEHHGYDPTETPVVFAPHGLELEHHSRFQLGCNHLFVFRRKAQRPQRRQPAPVQSEVVGVAGQALRWP